MMAQYWWLHIGPFPINDIQVKTVHIRQARVSNSNLTTCILMAAGPDKMANDV